MDQVMFNFLKLIITGPSVNKPCFVLGEFLLPLTNIENKVCDLVGFQEQGIRSKRKVFHTKHRNIYELVKKEGR